VGTAKAERRSVRSGLELAARAARAARAGAGIGAVLAMLGGAAAASVDGDGEVSRARSPLREGDRDGAEGGGGVRLSAPARGGSIALDRERLVAFAADADNQAIHRVDLVSGEVSTTALECAPEQIALLGGGRVAVALRGCSKVALLQVDEAGEARVLATRDVPADPWGLAATPDGALLVTSAWGSAVRARGGSARRTSPGTIQGRACGLFTGLAGRWVLTRSCASIEARLAGYLEGATGTVIRAEASRLPGEEPRIVLSVASQKQPVFALPPIPKRRLKRLDMDFF
jgi:hypothetical protein